LEDLIFDKENELQIKKFLLGLKLDSNTFPMRYSAPNLDIGKASKSLLQSDAARIDVGATHIEKKAKITTTQVFFSLCAAPLVQRLGLGAPNDKWLAFLDST